MSGTVAGETLIQPDTQGSTEGITITAPGPAHAQLRATGGSGSPDGLLLLAAGFAIPGLLLMTLVATVLTRR